MAWRRNLQVSSVGTSAERLGVGADHDGGRAAGAKGAATEETRKGLRLRILPGTGCHRAGPPSKSGARAGGGRSDDFTQSNCGGTEAELATSATTCLHPQPPSRAYICVRNHIGITKRAAVSLKTNGTIRHNGPSQCLRSSFIFKNTANANVDAATKVNSAMAVSANTILMGNAQKIADATRPTRLSYSVAPIR